MINFSNYYCLVILLSFRITACIADNSNTIIPIETLDSDISGSADDVFGLDIKFDPDVCELPIDEGDCRNESLGTNEDSDSDSGGKESFELNYLNELNGLNEFNESNGSNTLYFGFNRSTKKCEQFNYDGCGGNENRFESINECRKTCYTPLKNFLARVRELVVLRVSNGTNKLFAT